MISRFACGAVALAALSALAACDGTEGLILGVAASDDDAGVAVVDAGTDIDATLAASSIVFVDDGGSTALQGGPTGDSHVDVCPGDQVVVGYDGYVTLADAAGLELVGATRAICGALVVVGSRVTVTPGAVLTTWGDEHDVAWSAPCPQDGVVVGISGRSGASLDQLAIACAPWSVVDDGGPALVRGAVTVLAGNGGGGGSAFDVPCPDGEMARGSDLRSGQWIDAFGLVCARPTLR